MAKKILDNTTGYIEGFYGKLLNWDDRYKIVCCLNTNKMNTYLYAPKEDVFHRKNWRTGYKPIWRKEFKKFTNFSNQNKIDVLAGISPGLDFDFKQFYKFLEKSDDFILLLKKSKSLLKLGAKNIVLMLDDIPDNSELLLNKNISEGRIHGILANKLSEKLKRNIYFVPRVYADELAKDQPNYLIDLGKVLNKKTCIFYSGANIVSKTIKNNCLINKLFSNKIIFWDNFYANDYCPRRLFVGPLTGRYNINNLMYNLTGLLNTDLLILDIIKNTKNKKNPHKIWLKTIEKHGVPIIFNSIKKFFSFPNFGPNPKFSSFSFSTKYLETIEFLLWSWKTNLSREWYPFLFGLKHDLQLTQNLLTYERLIKTQTLALSKHLNKK